MDPAPRSSVPEAGSLVGGRYRVDRVIGEGGMGVVLAAYDEAKGQAVALKLLRIGGDAYVERFLREARLAGKLESEHVVRVLDIGAIGEHPFLVMDRLEGEDFAAKLRRRTTSEGAGLPLSEVVDCVLQTCEALAHAHGAGIVHRDVKASNLFEHCTSSGQRVVKVLDFGICRVVAGAAEPERTLTRTRDGGLLGSPPYMSPEHVRDPRTVDGRADLWSLGVVFYRLLSARYPFAGESTGEVLAAILERRPSLLREHGIDVPEAIESIVARCLARAREDRYPDAGELAAALSPFASTPALRAYGDRVREIVRRSPGRAQGSAPSFADEPHTQTVPPPVAPPAPPAVRERIELFSGTMPMATAVSRPTVAATSPAEPAPTAGPARAPSRSGVVKVLAPIGVVVLVGLGAVVALRSRGPARSEAPPLAISPSGPAPSSSPVTLGASPLPVAEVDPSSASSAPPSASSSSKGGARARPPRTTPHPTRPTGTTSAASLPSRKPDAPNPYGNL